MKERPKYLDEKNIFIASHNWFICNGRDILLLDTNISLGKVLQIYTFEFFYPYANSITKTKNLKNIVKYFGYDWQLRFFHSKFIAKSEYKNSFYDILLMYDVNNKPMIENLNLIATELLKKNINLAAITIDNNIRKQIIKGIPVYFLSNFYKLIKEKEVFFLKKKLINNIKKYKGCIYNNFKNYEIPQRNIKKFFRYINTRIAQTIREIFAIENLFKTLNPKIFVSSTDAHKISRIGVYLAKNYDINTFVIQHGAPVWEYAYTPVIADKIFVWGEESYNWFKERGVPEEKLIITGCPRYDILQPDIEKIDIKDINFGLKGKPNICLFTNPIDLNTNSKIIKYFVSLPKDLFNNIYIKVHPSEDINFYKRLLKNLPSKKRTNILQSMGIPLELKYGDIAIVGNSTIGIEAIAKGLILINLELENFPNPIPYKKYKIGVYVREINIKKGVKVALSIRNAERYLEYLDRCKLFLEKNLYKIGNNSSSIIVNFLETTLLNL